MTQTRAERTRRRVLRASAAEFARRGYAATALSHITRAAGVTTGAIMFHFASKRALADAVCAQGHERTRRAVAHSIEGEACALQAVVDMTHALVLLLDDDSVRAASRLAYEIGGRDAWYGAWLPSLHALSVRAERERELKPGVEAESVTLLAASLVAAAETAAWQACARMGTPASVQLTRVWSAVMAAIRSPWCAHALRPEGSLR